IKVLFMDNGRVKDFKLNSQCSAGNGYFLQGMAQQFGIDVREYADYAFKAEIAPTFNYGCAVFMEQDKINFQQLGWQKEEMMAGLALVLPLNIWQYIVQEPNLRKFGKKFVLQGGTQYNLAAVKAQVDYIKNKVPDSIIHVHKYTGVSGAHGVALETINNVNEKGKTSFIGLDEAIGLQYTASTNEETRCYFCPNHCSRVFIDTKTPSGHKSRFISGYACEKGSVEDKKALHLLNQGNKENKKLYPNLVDYAAKLAFRTFNPNIIPSEEHIIEEEMYVKSLFKKRKIKVTRNFQRANKEWIAKRNEINIGIPRVLNLYSTAPFWRSYFEAIGIPHKNIIFSSYTSDELWSQGGKWGSIDPCFPAKVTNAHVHNLIFKKSVESRPINIIFNPIITHFTSSLKNTVDSANCSTSSGNPEVIKAAFTREKDIFKEHNIIYHCPYFKMDEENLFINQLYNAFKDILGVTEDENLWAYKEGMKAINMFDSLQKEKGKEVLEQIKSNNKVGILLLGRPYHNDPGLNHDILESLQAMGFPILSMQSLPQDEEFLNEIFADDLKNGIISHPMEITDVWKNCFSENGSFKIWAAKVAVRHPNLVIIDLSNFKCGHDSPLYSLIDDIVKTSKTPHFTFHDIDENKPRGSIKIRTRTIKYFLDRYEIELSRNNLKEKELKQRLEEKRRELTHKYENEFSSFSPVENERKVVNL
ncbi:MAG: acyl-CoA dehydratase activase-related protein, partial [Spirochaetota bacterium]|nr:acyl-CoA dehydratase activase-related protein [Spirochaetota bacterium]